MKLLNSKYCTLSTTYVFWIKQLNNRNNELDQISTGAGTIQQAHWQLAHDSSTLGQKSRLCAQKEVEQDTLGTAKHSGIAV